MIYLFLADGFEQIEALTPLDILRRAKAQVKTVSVTGTLFATSTLGVTVSADITPDKIIYDDTFEGVILPGGMPGAENLKNSDDVVKALSFAKEKNVLIAAICAAPFVLGQLGILKGKKAVCYPGYEKDLIGAERSDEAVCVCGNIITAVGAGVSLEFGLAVAEYVCGKSTVSKVAEAIQCRK